MLSSHITVLPDPIEFEWDTGNQTKSLKKHGITSQEAEEVFVNHKLVVPDQRHSSQEARYGVFGRTNGGKILFIAFTIRKFKIRVISARLADRKERVFYEQEIKKIA